MDLHLRRGPDTPANREQLDLYVRAKKHLEHANRPLGAFLNTHGTPRLTIWLAHPPEDDLELDALARAMRLISPDRAPNALPPKAKRQRQARRRR